jgi:hypothetical protein
LRCAGAAEVDVIAGLIAALAGSSCTWERYLLPGRAACLARGGIEADGLLVPAETHEGWLEATRYLNMEHLKERKKEALRAVAA